jgi:hypothetical protein
LALTFFAALCGIASALAPTAGADAFGEIQKIGEPLATGATETEWLAHPKSFSEPGPLGVDPETGNVYVVDNSPSKQNARLQEFSQSGQRLASAILPRAEVSSKRITYTGVAVDPTFPGGGRLYLVESGGKDSVAGEPGALKLLVYSMEPVPGASGEPGTLQPVSGLSAGLALPSLSGPNAILEPAQISVEPSSHCLLIVGWNALENTVIARFEVTPSAANELARYVGSTEESPMGVAVSKQTGKIYLALGSINEFTKIYEVAPALTGVTELAALTSPGTGGAGFGTKNATSGAGPHFGISPDGGSLYYTESIAEGATNFLIRGISLTGKTTALYGNGGSTCFIHNSSAALAVGPDGQVWAVDPAVKTAGVTTGGDLLEFGPGGSGCPLPNPRFSVNGGNPEESSLSVQVGQHLTLQADTTQLHGGTATMLEWDLDGSGQYATQEDPASATSEEVCFEEADPATTLGLRMKVSGGTIEEPAPVTKSVTVTSQPPAALLEGPTEVNAGEAAAFDGSRSFHIDCSPTGTGSEGQTYEWSFGDGSSGSSSATPSHTFGSAGTYAVKLKVTDKEGLVGEAEQPVTVKSVSGGGDTGGTGGGDTGGGNSGGNGGTGGGGTGGSGSSTPAPTLAPSPKPTPAKPKQTPEQIALAKCAKKHGKAKTACLKAAKKKFAKKPKAKK